MRAFVFLVYALLAFAVFPAFAAEVVPRPNILLVVVDTLRADHLGVYGYSRPTSPVLDALAREGTLFTRAYSTSSWTQPAVASLFTGTRPAVIAPRSARYILARTPVLAAELRKAGYRTAGFVANPVLHKNRGYGTGFEVYDSWILDREGKSPPKASAEWVNGGARAWLSERLREEKPWFLYVHYMEPHTPYEPDEKTARVFWRNPDLPIEQARERIEQGLEAYHRGEAVRFSEAELQALVDLYDASVRDVDAAIGDLLSFLPPEVRKRTVVCVTADHGEELHDHGGFLHAHTLYDELLRVPLLFVVPGRPGGEKIGRIVQLSGVAPTLLRLVSLPVPDSFEPIDLFSPTTRRDAYAYAELAPFTRTFHHRALVRGPHKLVLPFEGKPMLFDLLADPGERRDLSEREPALAAELARDLDARAAETPRLRRKPPPTVLPDASLRERLRALGYDF
ncbi:MAG: hypothetical protein KatS3mg076_3214 [Candidatus Binatia bacterium]|nr:MAG: hypothetical protein KatS3mg076_3214 [Candidatus Binatia bacterium]